MNKNLLLLLACVSALLLNACSNGDETIDAATPSPGTIDPFLSYAWHLKNLGQKVFADEAGTTGEDIRISTSNSSTYTGLGVKVLISDDGVESSHEDLTTNFTRGTSKNFHLAAPYTASVADPTTVEDNHGTCVAGLIAAEASNGVGSKGVAPGAKLSAVNLLSSGIAQTLDQIIAQADMNFDVINQSWGASQVEIYDIEPSYETHLKYLTESGRSGKGTIIVKAAGNDFFVEAPNASQDVTVGNSNFDGYNSVPYVIVTSALNAKGQSSSYSSAGSNLWVSTPGGEFGDDSPAMMTTDRSSCNYGYSKASSKSTIAFEKGSNSNGKCNYTVSFNGTSSATPVLTGAIAVLLQANPALTWRDVKHILASTSIQTTMPAVIPHPLRNYGYPVTDGIVWEQGWITNSAGYKFQNWYGFGKLNLDAAIAMATSYSANLGIMKQTKSASQSWFYTSAAGLGLSIPNNSSTGTTHTINVKHNYIIEAVQIRVTIAHANAGELGIELTSPNGTKSILMNVNNSLDGQTSSSDAILLSNAFYGEPSIGNWTIKVLDGSTITSSTGSLNQWGINIIGHVNPSPVDTTAPSPASGITHVTSNNSLVESPTFSFSATPPGDFLRYEYSIGTSAGATNVLAWTPTWSTSSLKATGLTLVNNTSYYINVRVIDNSENASATASSSSPWVAHP